jgi:hypothetical protein
MRGEDRPGMTTDQTGVCAVAMLQRMNDDKKIRELNEGYVRAYMSNDVDWYDRQLSADFVCIESDGVVRNKRDFLAAIAAGTTLKTYVLNRVDVYFYGAAQDVALVRCSATWTAISGATGGSEYVDVYVRQDDVWKTVSAQIT